MESKFLQSKNFKFFFIISIFFFNIGLADIVKPNTDIAPHKVVKIQLNSLMQNNIPHKDNGIEQTWQFAHPNNKIKTGPIDKFKIMIKSKSYSMLLNHKEHSVEQVYLSEELATFEVVILDTRKRYYKFIWQIEKYKEDGPLKNCWLTTVVSQPIPMGSSI